MSGSASIDAALRLIEKGKVRRLMMSSHNRASLQDRFGRYAAEESSFDAFMLRYNAANRGAEHDAFPHVHEAPRPGILAHTATRWAQLLDPRKMPAGEPPPPARDCHRFALSHPAGDLVL